MTTNFKNELNHNIDLKNQANCLGILIQGYRLCARTEGKSENTITIYTTALKTFSRFLTIHEYLQDVAQLGTLEIREFIVYLQNVRMFEHHPFTNTQEKKLSGHAANCYMRALRAFWSWLMREEFINSNPFSKIVIPKPPKKIVETFSEKQIQSLLKVINIASPTGFRDWTMILMLLDTGIRASELSGLTTTDVKLEEGFIKVCGKGNKERIVPIGTRVQKALWKYMQRYRPILLQSTLP